MGIESLYWSSADQYKSAPSSRDSIGGDIRSVSLYQAGIPCYYTRLTAGETAAYGKQERTATHRLFCGMRDISTTDLWLIGGKWYSTVFPEDACSLGHHMEVIIGRTDAPEVVECSSSSSPSSASSASSASSDSSESSTP